MSIVKLQLGVSSYTNNTTTIIHFNFYFNLYRFAGYLYSVHNQLAYGEVIMGFGKRLSSANVLAEEVTASRYAIIDGAVESTPVVKDIVFKLSDNKRWYSGEVEDFEPTPGFLNEIRNGRFDVKDRDVSLYFGGKASNCVVLKFYIDVKFVRLWLADCVADEDVMDVLSRLFHEYSDDIKSIACYFPAVEL